MTIKELRKQLDLMESRVGTDEHDVQIADADDGGDDLDIKRVTYENDGEGYSQILIWGKRIW